MRPALCHCGIPLLQQHEHAKDISTTANTSVVEHVLPPRCHCGLFSTMAHDHSDGSPVFVPKPKAPLPVASPVPKPKAPLPVAAPVAPPAAETSPGLIGEDDDFDRDDDSASEDA